MVGFLICEMFCLFKQPLQTLFLCRNIRVLSTSIDDLHFINWYINTYPAYLQVFVSLFRIKIKRVIFWRDSKILLGTLHSPEARHVVKHILNYWPNLDKTFHGIENFYLRPSCVNIFLGNLRCALLQFFFWRRLFLWLDLLRAADNRRSLADTKLSIHFDLWSCKNTRWYWDSRH